MRAETVGGQEPEFGYPQLSQLLCRAGVTDQDFNLRDMRELLGRMVFNILIDNTDDHEKNHAFRVMALTQRGRYRPTPAHQLGSGPSGVHRRSGLGESTLDNATSQCELFGLTRQQAAEDVIRIIQAVNGWNAHFAAHGVATTDIDALAEYIDGDALLSQRRDFTAATYLSPVMASRRKGPFSG